MRLVAHEVGKCERPIISADPLVLWFLKDMRCDVHNANYVGIKAAGWCRSNNTENLLGRRRGHQCESCGHELLDWHRSDVNANRDRVHAHRSAAASLQLAEQLDKRPVMQRSMSVTFAAAAARSIGRGWPPLCGRSTRVSRLNKCPKVATPHRVWHTMCG